MRRQRAGATAPKSPPPGLPEKSRQSIPLVVPASLESLARECEGSYNAPLEIQTYSRLGKTLVKRLAEEPIICAADLRQFLNMVNGSGDKPNGDSSRFLGKALLLGNPDQAGHRFPHNAHGIELIPVDVSPALWTFMVNKAIAQIEYDREVQELKEGDVKKGRDLYTLNEIGMALSTEKDLDKLLDLIVTKCREMTVADGGSLYMIEAVPDIPEDPKDYFKNKKMRFRVAQNFSREVPFQSFLVDIKPTSIYGYVAINQKPLNIPDAYLIDKKAPYTWGGREFDAAINYRTMSMMTVPMVNYRGETIGVIQLVDKKYDPELVLGDPATCIEHISPFTADDERLAMSIASQASIAVQNAQLVKDIQNLFNGFIKASVKAIESRDPTTGGHSERVAQLTVALAEKVSLDDGPKFRDVRFSESDLQELRYASLLHDFGKIGVRENVLIKAKKLYPAERQQVLDRFHLIRRTTEVEQLRSQVEKILQLPPAEAGELVRLSQESLNARLREVEEYLDFIMKCNEPTVLAQGGFDRLHEIAKMAFAGVDGSSNSFLTEKELISLSVPKGSLNETDRKEIESHVTHTFKFLNEIPWTKDLRRVPIIAYAHHEKLDGTGYPNKLMADQIPMQSKMMTISDIFDALTAWDRPYKKAVPIERALNILVEEAGSGHIDRDLLDVFIKAELFKLVEQKGQP